MNRIRVESGVYHCISRANGRLFLLDPPEVRERFVAMLGKIAAFCSMEVLSFCVMGNHFHVLAREVPVPPESFDDAELERRLHLLYEPSKARILFASQQAWRRRGDGARADRIREGYRRMTGDVSWFMRLLKQRFSVWYNRTRGREGTLWSERFRSVAVEDSEEAVGAMAAYIDLNPVRAGMVEDPRDYRWSTAGAAAAGSDFAREAIGRLCALAWEGGPEGTGGALSLKGSKDSKDSGRSGGVDGADSSERAVGADDSKNPGCSGGVAGAEDSDGVATLVGAVGSEGSEGADGMGGAVSSMSSVGSAASAVVEWKEAEAWWRGRLAEAAGEVRDDEGRIVRRGMDEGARARLAAGDGPVGALMRRVRHFARGAAIGSRAFVKGIVEGERGRKLPANRKSEGSRIPGKGLGKLYSLRKLARERPAG